MKKRASSLNTFRQQWLPSIFVFILSVFGIGYLRAISNPPLYKATGQLLLSDSTSNQDSATESNDLTIIQSDSLADHVLQDLDYSLNKADLKENFEVNLLEEDNILALSFTDENAQQAANVVNTWLENYLEITKKNQPDESKLNTDFLAQQLSKSEKSLKLATEKLRKFQEQNKVMDATAETTSTLKAISEFEAKIASFQAQLESLKIKKQSLQSILQVPPQTAINASLINESPVATSLLQKLQDLQIQLKQERTIYNDQHPKIISLVKEEEILQQQLNSYLAVTTQAKGIKNLTQNDLQQVYQLGKGQQNLLSEYSKVERDIDNVEGQITALQKLIADYKKRLDELRQLEFKQQELKKEVTIQEDIVQNLRNNYQATKLTQNNAQQNNSQSVKFAPVPKNQINPSLIEYLIQGVIAGLFLSLLTGVIIGKLVNKEE